LYKIREIVRKRSFLLGPTRGYIRRIVVQLEFEPSVEAVSNTSTVSLRVIRDEEKGTQCLGVQLGHPVPGGYKYADLILQLGEVSSLRQ
jgi:hypothetical protein